MLWGVLLWIFSYFCSLRMHKRNTLPVPVPVPTGSVRYIDLVESRIVQKVSMFRPLSLWVWPGKRLNVSVGITQVAHHGGGDASRLVEVDMSDGTVQCCQGSGSEQHHGIRGIRGISTHIILAFFRGCAASASASDSDSHSRTTSSTVRSVVDLSSFLNARRSADLFFEDVVSLVIAHGLLSAEARPTSLCIVLSDLSERTFQEGQVVVW